MTDEIGEALVIQTPRELLENILSSIRKKGKDITGTILGDLINDTFDDIERPSVEIMIFSIEKDIGKKDRILRRKLYIRNDYARVYHNTKKERLTITSHAVDFTEVSILGCEIQHSGIHGKKIQLSISEYNDFVWGRINTGDLILVRAYLDKNKDNFLYTLDDYIIGSRLETLDALYDIDFSGMITNKMKDVGSTEQFRIEAVDILNILRELNMSITTRLVEGEVESHPANQSDLINMFVEALFTRFLQEKNTIGNFDPSRTRLSSKSEFYEVLSPDAPQIFKKNFIGNEIEHTFFVRTQDSGEGRVVVYSFFMSTVKAVQYIIDYVLSITGLKQFFDVKLDSEKMKEYLVREAQFLMEEGTIKPIPMIMMNAYFFDSSSNDNRFNIIVDDINDLTDIKDNLMFVTFGNFPDLSFMSKNDIYRSISDNGYIIHTDPERLKSVVDILEWYLLEEKNPMILTYNSAMVSADVDFVKTMYDYRFNNFFDVINGNKVAIRTNQYRTEGSGSDIRDAIPVSMLLYYAYSLYNFTPVYNNVFKKSFKTADIKAFNSYNFMYSLAQSTWLMSGFQNIITNEYENNFTFIIVPMCTPLMYSEITDIVNNDNRLYREWHKGKIIKTSDLLEFEFNQLELNRKILFLVNDEDQKFIKGIEYSNSIQSRLEYIRLDETDPENNDQKQNFQVDMFGIQTINPYKNKKEISAFMDAFKREYSYEYNDQVEYHKAHMPIYPIMYVDENDRWTIMDFDDTEIPAGCIILQGSPHEFSADLNSGVHIPDRPYVLPSIFVSNESYLPFTNNGAVLPLAYYIASEFKDGKLGGLNPYVIESSYTTLYVQDNAVDFQMRININDEDEGYVNLYIGGTKSYVDLDKIKQNIEFLTYKNLLPQQIRDAIRIRLDPIDTANIDEITRTGTIDEEYSLDDILSYLINLVNMLRTMNGESNQLPLYYTLTPDYNAIFILFRDFFNTVGLYYDSDDLNANFIGQESQKWIYKVIYQMMKNPIVVSGFDGITPFDIAPFTSELQEQLGRRVNITANIEKVRTSDRYPLDGITNVVRELFKWLYSIEVFVQDILRNNYHNGSLYMPNRGNKSNKGTIRVGDLIFLVDDREKFHLEGVLSPATTLTGEAKIIKQQINMLKIIKSEADPYTEEVLDPSKHDNQDFIDPAEDSVFFKTRNGRREKPYGWFVWKTVSYMGDASAGNEGTSGYTHKIYLARDGVNWFHNYEEGDFLTSLVASMADRGYKMVIPEILKV